MHHQLATSLSQDGHKILYVDNTGVRPPSISRDRNRIARKLKEIIFSTYGFRASDDSITILSPLLVPHPYNRFALTINSLTISAKIQNWLANGGLAHAPVIVVTFLPTPLIYQLCKKIGPNVLVYYCANDMAGEDPSKAPLIPWEIAFFKESNQVLTISAELTHRAGKSGACVSEVPPGLDDKFLRIDPDVLQEPDDLASIPHPRIGYIGALASATDVFDVELFLLVVQNNKHLNFILIGPAYGEISVLLAEENIFVLGPKSHEAIASYLTFMDVALIPYRVNRFTNSVNACKLNEYLYFGLPVVSTPFAEAIKIGAAYPGLIYLADSSDSFSAAIRKALSEVGNTFLSQARNSYAISTCWSSKYASIRKVLDLHLERSLQAPSSMRLGSFEFIPRGSCCRFVLLLVVLADLCVTIDPYFGLRVGSARSSWST